MEITNSKPRISLILLYCGVRTGHFGMGSHTRYLLSFLKDSIDYAITVLKLDSVAVNKVTSYHEESVEYIEVPRPENKLFLTADVSEIQITYAERIMDIVYPYLKEKLNLLVWSNHVDHANICNLIKSNLGGKVVYVHHNFSWKSHLKVSYNFFKEKWLNKQYSYHPLAFELTKQQQDMVNLSDKSVTVTKMAKDFFIDALKVSPIKIETIYNGIPSNTLKMQSINHIKSKYGFDISEKIIIYCGRIATEKGIDYIIRAFVSVASKMPNVRLLLVGDGDIGKYMKLAFPFWNRITCTGEASPEIVGELYSIADVGVMASTQEQCSITAIEMRYYKIPLIVSAIEGLDELFTDGFDALKLTAHYDENNFMYLSADELAHKFLLILNDPNLAYKISSNSYNIGLKHFNAEEMVKSYDRVFKSCFSIP